MFSDILLTVDFDGTLTGPGMVIPSRNLEAIRFFMENGGAFTVNTGRSLPMYRSVMDKVPVNAPLLLYNGGAAYDTNTGDFLFTKTISLDMWQTMGDISRMIPGMHLEIQGVDAHYSFSPNRTWEILTGRLGCAWQYAAPGDNLGPFLKFALLGPFAAPDDIFGDAPANAPDIAWVIQTLQTYLHGTCTIFHSGRRIVDVQATGASKANSALWLKERLGRKTLICVGDGRNDAPMLSAADYSFCPADGVIADSYPNLCSSAEGAIAHVIYEKIPGILQGTA